MPSRLFVIKNLLICGRLFILSYVPDASDTEFAPSPVPAGALQATAAVLYVAQAAFLEACQVLRAVFVEALNVAQAVFTALLTADVVVD